MGLLDSVLGAQCWICNRGAFGGCWGQGVHTWGQITQPEKLGKASKDADS